MNSSRFFELLSSMRLAIVILITLSIASIIGTVVPQMNPTARYTEIFGLFWTQHLEQLGVFNLYNSIGFLILLIFLLISTSICIINQSPKILKEMKRWHVPSIPALNALPFYTSINTSSDLNTIAEKLKAEKWRVKQINESTLQAKFRPWSKLGYWAAHGGIIFICLGGFLDSQIPLRMQMWWDNSVVNNENPPVVQAFSFRSNLFVPEKTTNNQAVINLEKGIALQELPFNLTLNDFNVEHYPTGMPKRFVSDVTITDKENGQKFQQFIEVNKPLRYKGVTVYQSSFEDGGSILKLKTNNENTKSNVANRQDLTQNLTQNFQTVQVGQTFNSFNTLNKNTKITLDEYRLFNIEDFKENDTKSNSTVGSFLLNHGSNKTLKNIGDSVRFHTNNAAGQVVKYHQYLQPIQLKALNDLGVETTIPFIVLGQQIGNAPMNYLRIPIAPNTSDNSNNKLQNFINLSQTIQNKELQQKAILMMLEQNPKMALLSVGKEQFIERIGFFLKLFAQSGYEGLLTEMKKTVPQDKQEQVIPVMIQMVQRLLFSMYEMQYPVVDSGWFFQATLAYSQAVLQEFPLLLDWELQEHKYASIFQVAKNPGITWVYLGALLLILGVFIMLYVREQTLWFIVSNGHLLIGGRVYKQTIYWKQQTQELVNRLVK